MLEAAAPTISGKTGPGTLVTWKAEGKEVPEQGMSHSEAAWGRHSPRGGGAGVPTHPEREEKRALGPPGEGRNARALTSEEAGRGSRLPAGAVLADHLGRGGTEGSGHCPENL